MLTTWLLPMVQWNQTPQTRPRLLYRTADVTGPLSAASHLRIQWGLLLEQPPALAHAHLRGAYMNPDSSHKESPPGPPLPKASTGCSWGLNREPCVSSWHPAQKATSYASPSIGGHSREFPSLKEGRQGADPEPRDPSAIYHMHSDRHRQL